MARRRAGDPIGKASSVHLRRTDAATSTIQDGEMFRGQFSVHPQETPLEAIDACADQGDHTAVLSRGGLASHIHRRCHPAETHQYLSILPPQFGLAEAVRCWLLTAAIGDDQGETDRQVSITDADVREWLKADGGKRPQSRAELT